MITKINKINKINRIDGSVEIKSRFRDTILTKTMKNNRSLVLSLFSGCGGLDLGFAQAGADSLELKEIGTNTRVPCGTFFKVIWANDVLASSCETYSANFNAEKYDKPDELYSGVERVFQGDIAKIDFKKAVGNEEIDLVLGGFPCQDFSIIRSKDKRKGIKVKRGRLYCHFVRALAQLQPKMFVAENVKGLVSSNKGLAYKQILDDFRNLNVRLKEVEAEYNNYKKSPKSRSLRGYQILFSDVVNFANLGVPQARERLVIVGLRDDLGRKLSEAKRLEAEGKLCNGLHGKGLIYSHYPLVPIEVFYGKTLNHLSGEYANIMREYADEIQTVGSKRAEEYLEKVWPKYTMDIQTDYLWVNRNSCEKTLLKELTGQNEENAHKNMLVYLGYYGRPLDEIGVFVDNSNSVLRETAPVVERMKCIPPSENHEFVRDTEHQVVGLMSNIYRRIHPLRPSPTIIAKGGGGTWGYHFARNRQRLTNRERARLQTFPDSFLFMGKSWEVRNQLGEAVPPLASKVIAEYVAEILSMVVLND